ncbi:MAG: hypothetical protein JWM68_2265, partial [Verrucomicrobiales bacterium]|nr:hypothetical protein [Verrucomicrobiales bacterium]
MNPALLFRVLVLFLFTSMSMNAMFAFPQTENVPIERVLKNLESRLAQDTDNVEALYHLARVHSMAYSTNLAVVPVTKKEQAPHFKWEYGGSRIPEKVYPAADPKSKAAGQQHLTNAIIYYERASVQIFKGTNAEHHRWLIEPIFLGRAWCLDQAGRRDDAIKAYRKALQIAWHYEVEGDFTLKEQLEYSWDRIRAKQNPLTRAKRGSIGP